jgi:hypothetical protein
MDEEAMLLNGFSAINPAVAMPALVIKLRLDFI